MMTNRTLFTPLSFIFGALVFGCSGAETDGESDERASSASGGSGTSGGSGGATGGSPSGAGGAGLPDPCAAKEGSLLPQFESVTITSKDGGAPVKGEPLVFQITLSNAGTGVGPITVMPRIDSLRFDDFISVPAGSGTTTLCEDGAILSIEAGPFLDHDTEDKHYAVGSGDYLLSSFDLSVNGEISNVLPEEELTFHVDTSGAVFVPVVYVQGYFDGINDLTTSTPEDFLTQAFTRKAQLFTPSSGADPDGAGSFVDYPGGFDEMVSVKHLFRAFEGFPGASQSEEGWCEDAMYYGQEVLGLASPWNSGAQGTLAHRHGFDYLIALHPDLGGGVACWWLDVQVSSLINNDVNRQQIVAVHESAHVFGAPHCDDVGNGDGGSLQGYVMCSGEKHQNYPENFVFHSTSRANIQSRWD